MKISVKVAATVTVEKKDVEWVVNHMGEIGVKIGEQFFFCYKGESLRYEETSFLWRHLLKREAGESLHIEGYTPDYDDNGVLRNPYNVVNKAEKRDQVVCGDGTWKHSPVINKPKPIPELFDRRGRRVNKDGDLINEEGRVIDDCGEVIEYDTEADSSDNKPLSKHIAFKGSGN